MIFIYKIMEDSRTALFVEPNAYIQNYNKKENSKKVIFQEPYDCLPNYYIDNNFKKHNCDCVKKKQENHKEHCQHGNSGFSFDIKNLLPLLGSFGKGGGNLSNILSLFNAKTDNNSGLMSIFSNPNILSSLSGLLLNKKQDTNKNKDLICTDYQIKNYTRVD